MQSCQSSYIRNQLSLSVLIIVAILSTTAAVSGGEPPPDSAQAGTMTRSSQGSVFTELIHDLKYLTHENDFYAVMGGVTLGPIVFRKQFGQESPELTELWASSPFADNLFETGEIVGDALFPVSLSLAAVGFGAATGSDRTLSFGSKMLRAQTINGLMTVALKGSIDRTRPDGGPYSYPSGHTSAAFTAAGVVYGHYGKTIGISAFIVAGYVGLSRLQENRHYLSDVIAGALMGGYLGLKISRRGEEEASPESTGFKLRLNPSYQPEFKGARLSFGF